jgi:arachidonate 15-lipoxygenase
MKSKRSASTTESDTNRELQLAIARTRYNYTRTYPNLEDVPLCANVPEAEAFTADYNALVQRSTLEIAKNFLPQVLAIIEEELEDDANPSKFLSGFLQGDIAALVRGLPELAAEAAAEGPTALLKDTLWELLRRPADGDKNYLKADAMDQYAKLLGSLPKPAMLSIPQQDWMPSAVQSNGLELEQCQQDWYFGYTQVAGFNTTNLQGVVSERSSNQSGMTLADVQAKLPNIEAVFPKVVGANSPTLRDAAERGLLYVVDYTALGGDGSHGSTVHDSKRWVPAPIALFYWNETKLDGYPAGYGDPKPKGVLQPIAIRLSQAAKTNKGDPAPVFTPNNCADGNDQNGLKWLIAKYYVNVACGVQHESIAHLGQCHFVLEAVTIATHRQLSEQHWLFEMLAPHLRFTLSINHGALENLVIPEGVIATNVAPAIDWTLKLANDARKAWRWQDNRPDQLFKSRGVDFDKPLNFPFRDDTMLLWNSIENFVTRCLEDLDQQTLDEDLELQAWLVELEDPNRAALPGIKITSGAKASSDARKVTKAELIDTIAQIIYTAGPLHASVNYAQYPLGSYMPSAAGTVYGPPPTDALIDLSTDKTGAPSVEATYLNWMPPIDISLYTFSFEYLLSSIQYDRLGHYSANPQFPYFDDAKLQSALDLFHADLSEIEAKIIARNQTRPMAYPYQLPSRTPNSVSI